MIIRLQLKRNYVCYVGGFSKLQCELIGVPPVTILGGALLGGVGL